MFLILWSDTEACAGVANQGSAFVSPVICLHSIRTNAYFLSSFELLRQLESHRKENILSATKLHHDYIHCLKQFTCQCEENTIIPFSKPQRH